MPVVEFVGQSASDSGNMAANTARLINLYREPVVAGGKTRYVLRSVPGLESFADLGVVLMKAIGDVAGTIYSACGGKLFSVDSAGTVTELGSVVYGDATISANYGVVTVVSGGEYYTIEDGVMTLFDNSEYFDFVSAEYIGGYTVLLEKDGRRIQWSDLADATTLPGLNYATAEQRDDNNVRGMAINDVLWVFKETSIEQWAVTGSAGANAFQRIGGAVIEFGLKGFNLICRIPNGAAFIGSDGVVYMTTGSYPVPISTPPVGVAIDTKTPISVFYYERRDHKFIAITFEDAPAWVFDISTAEWHERAEGIDHDPWSARGSCLSNGEWFVSYNDGTIGKLNSGLTDFGSEIVRRAVSRTLDEEQMFRVKRLEFFARVGATDAGRDPELMFRFSKDGVTFGKERTKTLGGIGDYRQRIIFRSLGHFDAFAVDVRITDPVDVPIYADAQIEVV